jgi:hypothetical protein
VKNKTYLVVDGPDGQRAAHVNLYPNWSEEDR